MRTDVVILAGGRGQRFWPLSRSSRPKQVLRLIGESTLFEATVARALLGTADPARVWGVAAGDLAELLGEQSPGLRADRWIWEPLGRNTAPAIAAASVVLLASAREEGEEDRRLLVLPADHWIPDPEAFWNTVHAGEALVDGAGRIVTFGVPVVRPETGYGYIERGAALSEGGFEVLRFHEKPDLETARRYRESGTFYWNAGIFLFSACQMVSEIAEYDPLLGGLVADLAREAERVGVRTLLGDTACWERFFGAAPSVSVDYAVMEKSSRVAVVESGFAWDDLGSWVSWGDHAEPDASGNRTRGEVLAIDARDNIVCSEDGGLVALLGVEGLVVVRVGDATLVCPRERVQEIRKIVEEGSDRWSVRFR